MTCKLKKSLKKKPCDSYIKGGYCTQPTLFRCIEFIERNEPVLSHSGINNFMRCHRLYYYNNICGIQLKGEEYSDPLRIGIAVDNYLSAYLLTNEITKDHINLQMEIEYQWQAKVIAIIRAFLEKINYKALIKNYIGQKSFISYRDGNPTITGIIDFESNDKTKFIELKCGKSPEYYTNIFHIKYKLATYFMSCETYESGNVWVIRVPQLKSTGQHKDETLSEYSDRCYRVMIAQPAWYFPGYNSKTRNFGTRISREECDVENMAKYYKLTSHFLKIAIKEDTFMRNSGGCLYPFKCDYLAICESNGAISEDIYTYREKKK